MMRLSPPIDRDRAVSLLAVALLHVAIGWALLAGLSVDLPGRAAEALKTFVVAPEPPPPPVETIPPKVRSHRPEGAAAPPNLRSNATPVVAPTPVVPVVVPPPVIVAPIAHDALAPTQGAAPVAGPGTGAGGVGNGFGSGGRGDGDGGGGREVPLRLIRGGITNDDYPSSALAAGVEGVVGLRWTVGVDGRVYNCAVTRSSGNAALDATTCRLITERFRYKPTRDASGRKVPDTVNGTQAWHLHRPPPGFEDEGEREYERED